MLHAQLQVPNFGSVVEAAVCVSSVRMVGHSGQSLPDQRPDGGMFVMNAPVSRKIGVTSDVFKLN